MNQNHTYNTCASCHTEKLSETYRLTDSKGVGHDFCLECAGHIWHLAEDSLPSKHTKQPFPYTSMEAYT